MRQQIVAISLLSATICFPSLPARADAADAEKAAVSIRATSCQTRHGESGESVKTDVPRLNGQSASYLYARLQSMRYPLNEAPRAIHNMGGIAPRLQSQVMAALANYYAGQAPPQWHANSSASAAGERLYKHGAKTIPACEGCHGTEGQGRDEVPRLAGQHGEYLTLQLQAFAMAIRIADPMNRHVWTMTPEQRRAIAAYLGD